MHHIATCCKRPFLLQRMRTCINDFLTVEKVGKWLRFVLQHPIVCITFVLHFRIIFVLQNM